MFAAAELALLEMDHGRWTEAATLLAPGLGVLETHRMQDYATCVLALAAAARLALHLGDTEEAQRQLTRAMRARPVCTYVLPFIAVRTRLELARVCWGLGDQPAAQHLLHEIDDVLLRRPELGTLVDEVGALRGRSRRRPRSRAPGVSPLTPAELRLLPYLQTHLTIREIGDRLFVSRNTAELGDRLDLPQAGVSSRSDAVRAGDRDRPARRRSSRESPAPSGARSRRTPGERELGCRRDDAGSPTIGMIPATTSTISPAVAPAPTAASASAP